jgi:DNA invertase Pin-like site-specific DNA recombinase
LREHIDLSTPAGRMMAQVIAAMAEYETELRAERVMAGQAAARAAGKRWGGSKPGRKMKSSITPVQHKMIRQLKRDGHSIVDIANAVKLSRPTIYKVLAECVETHLRGLMSHQ